MKANKRNWWAEPERPRGIFTTRDRQFLLGELDEELDANAKRQKRYRLRKRVHHAIQDLAYLERFDLDDIGQLAEELSKDMEVTNHQSNNPRSSRRLNAGTRSLIEFYGEVFPKDSLEALLTNQLRINAALDYYEETGRYGLFDVELTTDLVEEMSVDELADIIYGSQQNGKYTFPSSGAMRVLDLHGLTPDPEGGFRPRDELSDPAQAILAVGQELAGESRTAATDDVVGEVAQREGISNAEAQEALREALYAGVCYEPEQGRLEVLPAD